MLLLASEAARAALELVLELAVLLCFAVFFALQHALWPSPAPAVRVNPFRDMHPDAESPWPF